jgi:hypothetical protein
MIVGLDLSLTATGIAHWEGDAIAKLTTVSSSPKISDEARLEDLDQAIFDRIPHGFPGGTGAKAELVVIEGLSFGSNTGSHSLRDGLHWLIRYGLHQIHLPMLIVPPMSLKKFILGPTKKGDNTKELMIREVWRKYGVEARDNNQADAAALAILGAAYLGRKPMTAIQREVIEKLKAGPQIKGRRTAA